jgi:hypothetical protein
MKRHGAVLALAALIVAAVAALAVAAAKGPKTDATQASFTAQRTAGKTRTCTGQDGNYAEAREKYAGAVTGDPRVSGKVIVRTHALINTDTGLGTSQGKFRILDPDTNHVKVHGKFVAAVTNGTQLEGVLTGHVRDAGGDPPRRDARLVANFRADATADGAVSGEFGSGSSDNTAVIQSGRCTAAKGGQGKAEKRRGQGRSQRKPKPAPREQRSKRMR